MQTQIFGHHEKSLHTSKTIRLKVNHHFFALAESVMFTLGAFSRSERVFHEEKTTLISHIRHSHTLTHIQYSEHDCDSHSFDFRSNEQTND